MQKVLRSVCVASLLFSKTVHADELVLGIGADDTLDKRGDHAVAALLEYHAAPFYSGQRGKLSLKALLQGDTDGDAYTGAGVYGILDVGRKRWFFVEGGLSVGYYHDRGVRTPGAEGAALRSSLGAGVHVSETQRLSISLDHLMNTSFRNRNPGSETFNFRYTFNF